MKSTIQMKAVEVQYHGHLVLVSAPITVKMPSLFDEERGYIAGAVEKRRREFIVGRGLARYGMELLGYQPQAIPVGTMRQPLWPAGLVGSITHTGTHCAVALGRDADFLSIGIDMETVGGVTRELWEHIFCPEECDYLNSLTAPIRQQMACLMFSAKEAYYKMQFPLTGILEGFTAVRTHRDTWDNLWVMPGKEFVSPLRSCFRADILSCSGESCVLITNS